MCNTINKIPEKDIGFQPDQKSKANKPLESSSPSELFRLKESEFLSHPIFHFSLMLALFHAPAPHDLYSVAAGNKGVCCATTAWQLLGAESRGCL